jgi:hypothetical protein
LFGPRYYYEAVPLMWLLAARGLLKLWRALSQPTAVRAYLLAGMRVGLAVLIGLGALGVMPARFEAWRGLYGITREPRRQIARLDTLQRNALIFVRIHHWGDYSELAWTNSLALDGDIVFALDEGPQANDAVRAAFPGRRVFYLDGHVLTELKTE